MYQQIVCQANERLLGVQILERSLGSFATHASRLGWAGWAMGSGRPSLILEPHYAAEGSPFYIPRIFGSVVLDIIRERQWSNDNKEHQQSVLA